MICLGLRPKLSHIIGFKKKAVQNFESWEKFFYRDKSEEDVLPIVKKIFFNLKLEDEFIDEFIEFHEIKNKSIFEFVPSFQSQSIDVFGMLPFFHFDEADMYSDSLLYTMAEANILKEPFVKEIPYEDLSSYIRLGAEELRESDLALSKRREVLHYDGNWGRQYPNHPLYYFDEDFDFAYSFFRELGLNISKSELGRYLIFDWC